MNALSTTWIERLQVQPVGFAPVTAALLEQIIQRIVAGVRPQKIILFGSYARGNPTPDSDLDLLVIMESEERPAERAVAVSRCLRPRPFPMDILVRTPAEIAAALGRDDRFVQDVLANGVVLYDQDA